MKFCNNKVIKMKNNDKIGTSKQIEKLQGYLSLNLDLIVIKRK